jgi:O-antigen/teichoic acid export membrane protein
MARYSSASLLFKLFATGCGFVFAVVAARLLGAAGYGVMSVALSATAIGTILATLGIDAFAVREVAASQARVEPQRLRRFIGWSVLTIAISSILVGLAVAAVANFAGPYREVLFVAALTVPAMAGLRLLRGITQGFGQIIGAQAPLDVLRWTVVLLLVSGMFVGIVEASATSVLLANLAAVGSALLLAVLILRRALQTTPKHQYAEHTTEHWMAGSAPFLGVELFGVAGTEIATLLLGSFAGPSAAGLYQPLAKLAPIMLLARDSIEMPLAPRIVEMWESGKQVELERFLRQSARASIAVTAALCALMVAISKPVFAAFGPGFADYRHYLYGIVAAQVVHVALGPAPLLMAMVGKMNLRLRLQLVTFIVQAGSGLLLIPSIGVAGAVFALIAGLVTWSFTHWLLAWMTTGIDTSAFALATFWRKYC